MEQNGTENSIVERGYRAFVKRKRGALQLSMERGEGKSCQYSERAAEHIPAFIKRGFI